MDNFRVCRLCICISNHFINIFEMNGPLDCDAATVIADLLQLKVSESDSYPKLICDRCLEKLEEFRDFKDSCLKSQIMFEQEFLSGRHGSVNSDEKVQAIEPKTEPKENCDDDEEDEEVVFLEKEAQSNDEDESSETGTQVSAIKQEIEITENPVVTSRSPSKKRSGSFVYCDVDAIKTKKALDWKSSDSPMQEEAESVFPDVPVQDEDGTRDNVDRANQPSTSQGNVVAPPTQEGSSAEKEFAPRISNVIGYTVIRVTGSNAYAAAGRALYHKAQRNWGDGEIYKCNVCGKETGWKNVMKHHLLLHTGERPHKCRFCPKAYIQLGNLRTHEKKHLGEKTYLCDKCPKSFMTQYQLKRHLTVHEEELRFQSGQFLEHRVGPVPGRVEVGRNMGRNVDQEQPSTSGGKNHEDVAAEDRGDPSNVEVYVDKYDPWENYQSHYEPQCEIQEDIPSTSTTFAPRPYATRYHQGRQNMNAVQSKGGYVGNRQSSRHGNISSTSANNHMLYYDDNPTEVMEDEPAICDLCGRRFSSKGNLEQHKRARSCLQEFRCTVCGKLFPRKRNLLRHMMTHSTDRPYKCEVCNKGFNSSYHRSRHQVIHTGERRFVCQTCNRSFTRKDKYNLHLRNSCTEAAY